MTLGPDQGCVEDIYDDVPQLPWWGDDGYDGSSIDPGAGEPG